MASLELQALNCIYTFIFGLVGNSYLGDVLVSCLFPHWVQPLSWCFIFVSGHIFLCTCCTLCTGYHPLSWFCTISAKSATRSKAIMNILCNVCDLSSLQILFLSLNSPKFEENGCLRIPRDPNFAGFAQNTNACVFFCEISATSASAWFCSSLNCCLSLNYVWVFSVISAAVWYRL